MISEAELRIRLASFVSGDDSLDDFEDWFTAASWNAHQDSALPAQKLVGAVELRLAEYSNGHLDLAELRSELEILAIASPVQVSANASVSASFVMYVNVARASGQQRIMTASARSTERLMAMPIPA